MRTEQVLPPKPVGQLVQVKPGAAEVSCAQVPPLQGVPTSQMLVCKGQARVCAFSKQSTTSSQYTCSAGTTVTPRHRRSLTPTPPSPCSHCRCSQWDSRCTGSQVQRRCPVCTARHCRACRCRTGWSATRGASESDVMVGTWRGGAREPTAGQARARASTGRTGGSLPSMCRHQSP